MNFIITFFTIRTLFFALARSKKNRFFIISPFKYLTSPECYPVTVPGIMIIKAELFLILSQSGLDSFHITMG